MRVETAQRSRPYPGFSASGDLVVVRRDDEHVMLAVIDVLGHGPDAARVAKDAGECLMTLDLDADVETWMMQLHRGLHRSRGAAVGLGRLRGTELQLSVVGNIEVRSAGTRVGVVASPGIVGRRLRKLRSFSFSMSPGDRVAMHSDGLRHVALSSTRDLDIERACDRLLDECAVPADDASILLSDFHDA